LEPGDVVADRFEIAFLAGSGAMGRVFKAFDRVGKTDVALKLMSATAPSERFQREAEVLAGLDHPNVVRYVAHGFSGTDLYIAMDWLEGEDLATRLLKGRLDAAETLLIAKQTADALGAAHAQGIVHRDVKPSNIILVNGSLSEARVVDFGLAAVRLAANKAPVTRSGMILGTPSYMAPEQVRCEPAIDARADIFSLGCVLFECLTLRCPFEGKNAVATFAKILIEEAPRASEVVRDVPEVLDELLSRMLSKSRDGRPENGVALAEVVARLIAAGPAALVRSKPVALTQLEQRLVCIVLLGNVVRAKQMDDFAPASQELAAAPLQNEPGAIARAPTMVDISLAGPLIDGAPSFRTGADPRLEALRAIATRFGGEEESLPDGSVVIVHGPRVGSADQVSRAARSALALRVAFPGVPMALAIGRSVSGQTRTMGEALDRASALLTEATSDHGIRISEVSVGLLEARFEIDQRPSGALLVAERQIAKAERTLLGRQTPCVGRERELSLLAAILQTTIAQRGSRAAIISAAPGVGKSRLRYEFLKRAGGANPDASVWVGWGDPMGAGSPFGLIAPLARRVLGIGDIDSTEERRQKVYARVVRALPPSEALRVAEFIGELVGAQFPDDDRVQLRAARRDAVLLGDQMLRAFGDFVAAEASRAPIIVVLEDIHWGDWSSLRFIDYAMARTKDLPFFVLALGRPEMLVRFPELWNERSVTRLALSELDAKASRAMIVGALGAIDETVIRDLIARSEGNAFFLEELIRALSEGRSVSLGTVLAVAQARLDGLTDVERGVLRAASVFGASFWRSGVKVLLGADGAVDLDAHLESLVLREVIGKSGERLHAGVVDQQYGFRHAILREAAHAMLTPDDCILGHRLAGFWLEHHKDRDPIVLAEHFERGETLERASHWYRRAAEQALGGNDFAAVKARALRAFLCGSKDIDAGELHLLSAEAHRWSNEHTEAAKHAKAAMGLLTRGSPVWFDAVGEAALACGRLGQLEEVAEVARELVMLAGTVGTSPSVIAALARTSDQLLFAGKFALYQSVVARLNALTQGAENDPMIYIWVTYVRAGAAMMNDASEYVTQMRALVASFEAVGDTRNALLQRINLADAYMQVGNYGEAATLSREPLTDSEQLRSALATAAAKGNLARALCALGLLDEARDTASACVDEMRLAQDNRMEAAFLGVLSEVLLKAGALRAAENAIRAALALPHAPLPLRSFNLARLAAVLRVACRLPEALQAVEEGMSLLLTLGAIDDGESFVLATHAECLLASGMVDAARIALEKARARLLAKASTMSNPSFRASFLTNVAENARTLALAEKWCGPVLVAMH
jgi:eukaryotic-like serine/threonine-protein kinase